MNTGAIQLRPFIRDKNFSLDAVVQMISDVLDEQEEIKFIAGQISILLALYLTGNVEAISNLWKHVFDAETRANILSTAHMLQKEVEEIGLIIPILTSLN